MSISAEGLRRLAALGLSSEAVNEVLSIIADSIETPAQPQRSANAIRQARYRERGGGKIPQALREAVFKRDGFACTVCSRREDLCCDHVLAVSKGGLTVIENLSTLCLLCNSRKKDRNESVTPRNEEALLSATLRNESVTSVTVETSPSLPPSPPPRDINSTPPTSTKSSPSEFARKAAFARFWPAWPNKVGKPAAEAALAKHFLEIDAIMAGLERYIADKPADRAWLNPATFLNQRRWEDQPATPPARAGPNGHHAKPSALSVLMEIENGTRKPKSDREPDLPFAAGAGPIIEGSVVGRGERDDPDWL